MLKKPRVFIAIHYLEIGGAETSLIGLLNAIDYNRVDVDLFVNSHQGELMRMIPSEVNLLPEIAEYAATEKPISKILTPKLISIAIARVLAKLKYSRFRKMNPTDLPDDIGLYQYMADFTSLFLPNVKPEVEYDLAINFCGLQNLILDKITARRKVSWIHTDYTKVATDRTVDYAKWRLFDNIVSISPDVTKSFTSVYPSLVNKIVEIENILSKQIIIDRAQESSCVFIDNTDTFRILSIGRFSKQKNFDNVPDICRRLVCNHEICNFHWYIIGYGPDEELILEKIKEMEMEDYITILGKKDNPYPYIKECDIYIQPSRYEGKSVTVREAQILRKPVIITDYPTANSQIRDNIDGVIVPLDNELCAKGIADFIRNDNLRKDISDNLDKYDYSNSAEISKFYSLIPGIGL